MVELGEDSATKFLCKMLARVNNVERDSQFGNETSRPIAIEWHTEAHTQIDKWGWATKGEPKCGINENALVAQH